MATLPTANLPVTLAQQRDATDALIARLTADIATLSLNPIVNATTLSRLRLELSAAQALLNKIQTAITGLPNPTPATATPTTPLKVVTIAVTVAPTTTITLPKVVNPVPPPASSGGLPATVPPSATAAATSQGMAPTLPPPPEGVPTTAGSGYNQGAQAVDPNAVLPPIPRVIKRVSWCNDCN